MDALLLDVGLPRALAALQAGVSGHVISMWALRGKVRIVGYDHRGHRLYHLGDILNAERTTRHSPNSRRHG